MPGQHVPLDSKAPTEMIAIEWSDVRFLPKADIGRNGMQRRHGMRHQGILYNLRNGRVIVQATPDQLQATPDQASAVSTRPFVSGSSSAAKISMP